ncbi:MAG: ATP-binding cassette domain-containing protein [Treponema sp.]|nr:ATP-binding cassette domain-containing protein [Treponema sp.]
MIEIRGLSFLYTGGNKNALSDINLSIAEGEFLGIIGSSGAGKSTLTYAINGVIPHHFSGDFYGEIRVNGIDTLESGIDTLARHVGSVFQDIDGQMVAQVVEDEILFGMENFGVPHDEIEGRLEDALSAAGIKSLRYREMSSLSGGQKQKAAIAAVIALRPRILVLDEPTGELDPQSSRKIFECLRELNEKHGITIIVIEQKIMLLCEFAKRLAVMNSGRLVCEGTVKDVLQKPNLLEDAGVNIPRVTTLGNMLKQKGLYSGMLPRDLNEAQIMVQELINKNGAANA